LSENQEERREDEQPDVTETPEDAAETPEAPAEPTEDAAETPEASAEPPETPAEMPEATAETPEATAETEAGTEPPEDAAETPEAAAEPPEDAAETPEAVAETPEPAAESAGEADSTEAPGGEGVESAEAPPADTTEEPQVPAPVDLGPDARYSATGKRKSSVARVIVRPGSGAFDLNGRSIDEYFPRPKHRAVVRQPLEVSGYLERVDIRARIHGGGVSGQADAVRHGIAKALIEADPQLRGELKRRQLLTRDPRVKERRKAGLKKARKRPQFSKR
jgi:small subunit ribosomal protein S9